MKLWAEGDRGGALAKLREARESGALLQDLYRSYVWILRAMAGERAEEELLDIAETSGGLDLARAWFIVGMRALVDGAGEKARRELERCAAAGEDPEAGIARWKLRGIGPGGDR